MPAKDIGKTLKELRANAKLSQKQAYEHIGVAQSTFSSWETGKAEPPTEILLKLCKLYKVDDVLAAFGYDGYDEDGKISLNMMEVDIIEKYRCLDNSGKETVTSVLDIQYNRCMSNTTDERCTVSDNVVAYKTPILNAAHERTDIEVTDEMRQHDEDIMDDENF
jgi:transcriptional regulator with XRE-family HTH domain